MKIELLFSRSTGVMNQRPFHTSAMLLTSRFADCSRAKPCKESLTGVATKGYWRACNFRQHFIWSSPCFSSVLRLFHVVSLNLNSINEFNDFWPVEAMQQPRGVFRTMETDTSFAQTAQNPLFHQSPSSYGPAPPPPDEVQRTRMHALPSPWTRAPKGPCLGCSPGSGD